MSTSKRGIVSFICQETRADKDDIRLHIDMFLAGVGQELAAGKSVNIKHFGVFDPFEGGGIAFTPSPTMSRAESRQDVLETVITGIGEDAAEELRTRLTAQVHAEQN